MSSWFKNTMENSKAINRFMKVEGLSQDAMYELYLECFFSYRDMFMERIRYGIELRRVIRTYNPIDRFRTMKPSELESEIFTSPMMHKWFVFRFWQAIERQVTTGCIDKSNLQTELTFLNEIPSTEAMEEILNDKKDELQGKCFTHLPSRVAEVKSF